MTVSSDANFDEVMKTHNMQLCALDEGTFILKILCQRKRVNIKLAKRRDFDRSRFGLVRFGSEP